MGQSADDLPRGLARRVAEARRSGAWASPRQEVVDRLLGSAGEIAPTAGDPEDLPHGSGGVRSGASVVAASDALVTRVFAEGELGLTVGDSAEGWGVVVRGRIWLKTAGEVLVLLVHGDHVLAMRAVGSGGEFTFEEVPVPDWELEIHMPGGRVLRVRDLEP